MLPATGSLSAAAACTASLFLFLVLARHGSANAAPVCQDKPALLSPEGLSFNCQDVAAMHGCEHRKPAMLRNILHACTNDFFSHDHVHVARLHDRRHARAARKAVRRCFGRRFDDCACSLADIAKHLHKTCRVHSFTTHQLINSATLQARRRAASAPTNLPAQLLKRSRPPRSKVCTPRPALESACLALLRGALRVCPTGGCRSGRAAACT